MNVQLDIWKQQAPQLPGRTYRCLLISDAPNGMRPGLWLHTKLEPNMTGRQVARELHTERGVPGHPRDATLRCYVHIMMCMYSI